MIKYQQIINVIGVVVFIAVGVVAVALMATYVAAYWLIQGTINICRLGYLFGLEGMLKESK